jgi:suppressor of ftsI/bilirubin oxidase
MDQDSRRTFLRSVAMLGVAAAAPRGAFAAQHRTDVGAQVADASAIEKEAAAFANPLRLPGESGLYGVLRASDVREVRVVRTEIEALPGQRTPFLAYEVESGGRRFLNPALLARRGDEMRVRMVNRLDEPTIIHWHGVSNDARNDGNPLYFAEPGKAYEYAFKLQDRASLYWYHPHTHGSTATQAYHGLAGLLFVEDDEEAALRRELDLALGETEIPLVLQDRNFDAQGRLLYVASREQTEQGFIGERLLVNFTDRPFITAARRIYRFRLLNGSNARTYRLAFVQGGRRLRYYLAGTDGGLLASPQRIDQAFISPGQRLDVLLDLREAKEGQPVTLGTLRFDPMHAEGAGGGAMPGMAMPGMAMEGMAMEGEPRALLRIDLKASPAYAKKIPATLSKLPPAKTPAGPPRRLKLAQNAKREWTINGQIYDAAKNQFTVKRGAAETWLIENDRASMPHPMHPHGFQFRILERRGSPAQVRALAGARGLLPQDLGFADTVHVWPGESVRIAFDFSHAYAGDQDYVFHCHNLEHSELGMMVRYRVEG